MHASWPRMMFRSRSPGGAGLRRSFSFCAGILAGAAGAGKSFPREPLRPARLRCHRPRFSRAWRQRRSVFVRRPGGPRREGGPGSGRRSREAVRALRDARAFARRDDIGGCARILPAASLPRPGDDLLSGGFENTAPAAVENGRDEQVSFATWSGCRGCPRRSCSRERDPFPTRSHGSALSQADRDRGGRLARRSLARPHPGASRGAPCGARTSRSSRQPPRGRPRCHVPLKLLRVLDRWLATNAPP